MTRVWYCFCTLALIVASLSELCRSPRDVDAQILEEPSPAESSSSVSPPIGFTGDLPPEIDAMVTSTEISWPKFVARVVEQWATTPQTTGELAMVVNTIAQAMITSRDLVTLDAELTALADEAQKNPALKSALSAQAADEVATVYTSLLRFIGFEVDDDAPFSVEEEFSDKATIHISQGQRRYAVTLNSYFLPGGLVRPYVDAILLTPPTPPTLDVASLLTVPERYHFLGDLKPRIVPLPYPHTVFAHVVTDPNTRTDYITVDVTVLVPSQTAHDPRAPEFRSIIDQLIRVFPGNTGDIEGVRTAVLPELPNGDRRSARIPFGNRCNVQLEATQ